MSGVDVIKQYLPGILYSEMVYKVGCETVFNEFDS